jgi:hypothetical protein
MADIPNPRTWVTNDEPTATMLNAQLRTPYNDFFWNPPRVMVHHSAGQSLASGTFTLLTWDTEWFDSDGMHSTSTNPSRLTCITAGIYEIHLHIEWESIDDADAGHRFASVNLNNSGGTTPLTSAEIAWDHQIVSDNDSTGAPQTTNIAFLWPLTASDYVEALAMQTSAVDPLDTVHVAAARTTFGAVYMGTG